MFGRNIVSLSMLTILILQFLCPVLSYEVDEEIGFTSGRQTVVSITISPSEPLSVDADGQIQFTASMYDANGDQVLGSPQWWSDSGTIDMGGLFTPDVAGQVSVHAIKDSVNQSVNLSVSPGWPDRIDLEVQSTDVMLGSSMQVNASMYDAKSNLIVDRTISWMSDCGNISSTGLWEPSAIGTCNITAHWNELHESIELTGISGPPSSIIMPSDLSVRSGESVALSPSLFDSWGNELALSDAGALSWVVASGSVVSGNLYLADAPGIWTIEVGSSSGANGSTEVLVEPAAITGLELLGPQDVVMAGEEVELKVLRTDVYGHVTNETVPLSYWQLEDGSLKSSENRTIWTPDQVGVWNLSVSLDGYSDSIVVEVVHGWATSLLLSADEDRLTADDQTVIWMQASDSRNNRWVVNGSWNPQQDEAVEWIEDYSSWARFVAHDVGNWTIDGEWFDVERQQLFSTSITIEVTPGEVAVISLQGEGQTISMDESLEMNPVYRDGDGNLIQHALLNWTVIKEGVSEDQTVELRLSKGVFHPEQSGSHEIRASTGSAFASVRFHVNHGQARTLTVEWPEETVVSGSEGAVLFTVQGTDLSGQTFDVNEMQWEMDENAGKITPDPAGLGNWYFEGHKAGDWEVELIAGQAQYTISLTVTAGPIDRLEANLSDSRVEQGGELLLTVKAYDEFNNSVIVEGTTLSVESTSGSVKSLGRGVWQINAEEGGENHGVTIRHGNLTQQRFFDVDGALLGGIFGSSNTTLLVGSSFLLIILGVLLYIRKGGTEEEVLYDDSRDVMKELHSQQPTYSEVQHVYQADQHSYAQPEVVPQPVQTQVVTTQTTQASAAEIAAQKARETGVMVAAQGTVQGQTGWYYDATGELTCWNVDAAGQWSRIQ